MDIGEAQLNGFYPAMMVLLGAHLARCLSCLQALAERSFDVRLATGRPTTRCSGRRPAAPLNASVSPTTAL